MSDPKKVVTEKRWGFLVLGELHDCKGTKSHAETCRRLYLLMYAEESVSAVFRVTLTYERPQ